MTDAPRPPRRRRLIWWILAAAALVVVAALVVSFVVVPPILEHRAAQERYAEAIAERDEADAAWEDAREELMDERAPVRGALDLAAAVTPDGARPYVGADLFDEIVRLADRVTEIEEGLPLMLDAVADGEAPDSTEELLEAARQAEQEAEERTEQAATYRVAAEELAGAVPDLEGAVSGLRGALPEQADRIEKENISAQAVTRIRLHSAARVASTSEEQVAHYIGEYVARAKEVEQSQASELEEKDQGDGLIDVRLEIEEFVRSITGDARVDFDWAPIVNGLGSGESAGGQVSWQYVDGGYATMALSNSVAAYWPDDRFESLVVHESGHVITSQCRDMLLDTFDGDVELMATAWAIGMGYTNTWGNGVDFYYGGVWPPDDLIEASKECR